RPSLDIHPAPRSFPTRRSSDLRSHPGRTYGDTDIPWFQAQSQGCSRIITSPRGNQRTTAGAPCHLIRTQKVRQGHPVPECEFHEVMSPGTVASAVITGAGGITVISDHALSAQQMPGEIIMREQH